MNHFENIDVSDYCTLIPSQQNDSNEILHGIYN